MRVLQFVETLQDAVSAFKKIETSRRDISRRTSVDFATEYWRKFSQLDETEKNWLLSISSRLTELENASLSLQFDFLGFCKWTSNQHFEKLHKDTFEDNRNTMFSIFKSRTQREVRNARCASSTDVGVTKSYGINTTKLECYSIEGLPKLSKDYINENFEFIREQYLSNNERYDFCASNKITITHLYDFDALPVTEHGYSKITSSIYCRLSDSLIEQSEIDKYNHYCFEGRYGHYYRPLISKILSITKGNNDHFQIMLDCWNKENG